MIQQLLLVTVLSKATSLCWAETSQPPRAHQTSLAAYVQACERAGVHIPADISSRDAWDIPVTIAGKSVTWSAMYADPSARNDQRNWRPLVVRVKLNGSTFEVQRQLKSKLHQYGQEHFQSLKVVEVGCPQQEEATCFQITGRRFEPKTPEHCDRPQWLPASFSDDHRLTGQLSCTPHSKVKVVKTSAASYCVEMYRTRDERIRPADVQKYFDINMICANLRGDTCFFNTHLGKDYDGRQLPSLKDPQVDQYDVWQPPWRVAAEDCQSCHQVAPFLVSPFLAQVPQMVQLRELYSNLGRYHAVGMSGGHWNQNRYIERAGAGNVCLSCHRIAVGNHCHTFSPWAVGRKSLQNNWLPALPHGLLVGSSHNWDFMPPDSAEFQNERLQADFATLMDCCQERPAQPYQCQKMPVNASPHRN